MELATGMIESLVHVLPFFQFFYHPGYIAFIDIISYQHIKADAD